MSTGDVNRPAYPNPWVQTAPGALGPPRGPVANPTHRPGLRRALLYGGVVTLFLASLVVLALFLGVSVGAQTALLVALFAALPLLVVVPLFLWLDRLEAEPTRYLLFAFLWGALCAPVGAVVLNTGFHLLLLSAKTENADAWSAVLSAPPVEEGLKGLAVLAILLVRRREFDGVIDGIVYAGLAGAGFAFSENILYLGMAYEEAGSRGLTEVFIVRCLLGPFAHPLFTACIGVGLGLAVSVAPTPLARVGFGLAGYACAILLHAVWNLSASTGTYWGVYLAFQMPVFAAFLIMLLVLRARESGAVRRYLSQYADAGWLTHPEVSMLASLSQRRAARAWAKAQGGAPAARSMRSFQDVASDLALLRARVVRGAAEVAAHEHERALLDALTGHRLALTSPPPRPRLSR
ncbi:MAG: PrsW family intramembrane metalloprotease [Candidatus Phosphoribacter sp.]|nr:PrsW family intramembrane metalloprotease [Actinomycetales bacterium]